MRNKIVECITTDYGLHIKLSGRVCKYDIQDSMEELLTLVTSKTLPNPFHVLLDCSTIEKPLCFDTSQMIGSCRSIFLMNGINRTAILYRSNAQIVDLTKIFSDTSVLKKERYISTMINKDAITQAERYLREGIEP
jgi:hypothetical protein